MSYTKNTWANGDTITAAKLNNMENGIANAGSVLFCTSTYDGEDYYLDKTAGEIYEAIIAGTPVCIKYIYNTMENYSGTVSFAYVVRVSNYNYTDTINIYATKTIVGPVSSNNDMGLPSVVRYTAHGLDAYPYFSKYTYVNDTYLAVGQDEA